jgi:hypothetical protein
MKLNRSLREHLKPCSTFEGKKPKTPGNNGVLLGIDVQAEMNMKSPTYEGREKDGVRENLCDIYLMKCWSLLCCNAEVCSVVVSGREEKIGNEKKRNARYLHRNFRSIGDIQKMRISSATWMFCFGFTILVLSALILAHNH